MRIENQTHDVVALSMPPVTEGFPQCWRKGSKMVSVQFERSLKDDFRSITPPNW